ncbi:MAG TPA: hypothetical protein VFA27_03960 [Vicinamibacterales bacterium]|nr:hypothetical protein [Vicinamibacterales bacterium]
MTRTTIVHTHGGGRFGNQLLLFGHLISLAATHRDLEIVHVPFWPYSDLCDGTRDNPLCLFSADRTPYRWAQPLPSLTRAAARLLPARVARSVGYRLPRLCHRLAGRRSIDLDYKPLVDIGAPEFVERLRASRWVLLSGYDLRAWDAFHAEHDRIRAFLRPARRFWDAADRFLAPLRQRHDPLVGVHIRRTDYRVWHGGRFCFDDRQYAAWTAQMRKRWGARTGFVLSADETVDRAAYDPAYCHWSDGTAGGSGHFLDAMTTLAGCDVVAAAPSTFAAWTASFGARPLLVLGADVDAATEPLLHDVWRDGRRHALMSFAVW